MIGSPEDVAGGGPLDGQVASESDVAGLLSRLMKIGLGLAVLLMLTGAGLAAADPGSTVARQSSVNNLAAALGAFEPGGYFDLGVLVLLATPVARVVVLLLAFTRRRNWVFCGLSLLILAILVASGLLGLTNE